MDAGPIHVALRVAAILDALGVPYLIGGAVASSILGEPRATEDVDVVADLRAEHVVPLIAALHPEFYAGEQGIADAVAMRRSFNVIHLETMRKVDIFVMPESALAQEEMRLVAPGFFQRDKEARSMTSPSVPSHATSVSS